MRGRHSNPRRRSLADFSGRVCSIWSDSQTIFIPFLYHVHTIFMHLHSILHAFVGRFWLLHTIFIPWIKVNISKNPLKSSLLDYSWYEKNIPLFVLQRQDMEKTTPVQRCFDAPRSRKRYPMRPEQQILKKLSFHVKKGQKLLGWTDT